LFSFFQRSVVISGFCDNDLEVEHQNFPSKHTLKFMFGMPCFFVIGSDFHFLSCRHPNYSTKFAHCSLEKRPK